PRGSGGKCGVGSRRPSVAPDFASLIRATDLQEPLQQLELAVVPLAARERAALVLDEALLDVAQERRWIEPAQAAAPGALPGAREDQALLRPGHADVEQAALLRQGRFVGLAPIKR